MSDEFDPFDEEGNAAVESFSAGQNVNLNVGGEDEELALDFAGVKEMDFTPLPVGVYDLKVIDFSTTRTKKGDPMYKMKFAPDVPEDDPIAGKIIFDQLPCVPASSTSKGSMWKVRQVLEAILGVTLGEGSIKFTRNDIMGRRFQGTLGIEKYYVLKDKSDPDSDKVERFKNVVEKYEADVNSIPSETVIVSGDFSR